jgi:hypothetical protein
MVKTHEERAAKMVEMVQQSRTESTARIAQLEAAVASAQAAAAAAAAAGEGGGGGAAAPSADAEELREKMQDALDRAEFAESKRLQMQEKINGLEQKLWAAEKALWDTEDRADEAIKKLEAKVLALQDQAAVRPADAAKVEGAVDVQLSEAQEKILVKVLKESKAKIKGERRRARS